MLQNTEFTEWTRPVTRLIVPKTSGPFWSAKLETRFPYTVQYPGS